MKAKGLRVFAAIMFFVGLIAGVVAFVFADATMMGIIAAILSVVVGAAFALILCIIANHKEKRERIRASMNMVEEASILDPVEDDAIIIADDIPAIDDIFEDDADILLDPVEEIVDAPKTKYQIVREKIIEHTPLTEEQLDKAEKIGKVALPVAAVASVALMAAKLANYQKNERRRRAFFDWLS